jgi:hypothetical protein
VVEERHTLSQENNGGSVIVSVIEDLIPSFPKRYASLFWMLKLSSQFTKTIPFMGRKKLIFNSICLKRSRVCKMDDM